MPDGSSSEAPVIKPGPRIFKVRLIRLSCTCGVFSTISSSEADLTRDMREDPFFAGEPIECCSSMSSPFISSILAAVGQATDVLIGYLFTRPYNLHSTASILDSSRKIRFWSILRRSEYRMISKIDGVYFVNTTVRASFRRTPALCYFPNFPTRSEEHTSE